MPVRLKGTRIERSRQFGDVYLALALWRGTGLGRLCEALLPVGKEHVAWEKIASVLVAARLCESSSELHIAEDWYRRTALCDLLQLDDAQINKDRLYRISLTPRVWIPNNPDAHRSAFRGSHQSFPRLTTLTTKTTVRVRFTTRDTGGSATPHEGTNVDYFIDVTD